MTKCMICGWNVLQPYTIPPNVLKHMHNDVKQHDGVCCELCMIGMYAQLDEYIWDGVNLVVFNKSDGEYHEPDGNEWIPSTNGQIKFMYNERGAKWYVTVK